MEFSIKTGPADKQSFGTAVVGVFENGKLSAAAKALDTQTNGAIKAALADGDLTGKAGTTLLLRSLANSSYTRILLVGLGEEQKQVAAKDWLSASNAALKTLSDLGSKDAAFFLTEQVEDAEWAVSQVVIQLAEQRYRLEGFKKQPDQNLNLSALHFFVGKKAVDAASAGLTLGQALASGMTLTKNLGNQPSNFCTPTHLANTAAEIAKEYKLDIEILERADMEKLGMGSLLSVAKGSIEPPKLVSIHYRGGNKKNKPVVLVGKGITFDTGGISLKPGEGMDEMKYDMLGAGSVLGVMKAIAEAGLAINVTGVIVTCENMPAGNASKPGDIVTTMSGQTVEILNTDAEGRLILCDTLTYIAKFEPAAVVDIATLTGACIIALGHVNTGLYANDDTLANDLLAAANQSRDWAWRMPLNPEYDEQLKSNFADIANIGGRPAGSVTAAMFLQRFAKDYTWAHLDIAGTAWKSGAAKGATGRPVPLLVTYLKNRANARKK
ncbi:leucyl aminopeptidase [Leeia sp. TBRC 13508]|uniref:Probable cytosol aminopeptidase n=1 Tax=Leeia speluncae TaxID=2884804 RepID=A0ABS8D738_9NEIS|nr:leucyl aminopeptidase [Leeia speluncae]MCB6184020.1 leucyl aminopeptidase [Leeia speluncae]